MPPLISFPMAVHPAAALRELADHEDAWSPDQQRHMNMRPYRDTHSIALRASIARLHTRYEDLTKTAPTPDWQRFTACARIAVNLADILGAPLGRVSVLAIRPHGLILPHRITGDYAREHAHYIVPLQTPDSRITCGEATAVLTAGECWSLDPRMTTAIENHSSLWHIHIAIDVAMHDRDPGVVTACERASNP